MSIISEVLNATFVSTSLQNPLEIDIKATYVKSCVDARYTIPNGYMWIKEKDPRPRLNETTIDYIKRCNRVPVNKTTKVPRRLNRNDWRYAMIEPVIKSMANVWRLSNAVSKHQLQSYYEPNPTFDKDGRILYVVQRQEIYRDLCAITTSFDRNPYIKGPHYGYECVRIMDKNKKNDLRRPRWVITNSVDSIKYIYSTLYGITKDFVDDFSSQPLLHEYYGFDFKNRLNINNELKLVDSFPFVSIMPEVLNTATIIHIAVPTKPAFQVSETRLKNGYTVVETVTTYEPQDGLCSSKEETRTRTTYDANGKVEKSQISHSKDGKEDWNINTDRDGKLEVDTAPDEQVVKTGDLYVYKYAKYYTEDDNSADKRKAKDCIIKLKIKHGTKCIIPAEENKLRCQSAMVVGIFPFNIEYDRNRVRKSIDEAVFIYELSDSPWYTRVVFDTEVKGFQIDRAMSAIYCDVLTYVVGQEVQVLNFDLDASKICGFGIHAMMSIEGALSWGGIKRIDSGNIIGYDHVFKQC